MGAGAGGSPPSVGLADISPSRGEINPSPVFERDLSTAISPLEGEMSDRTEGGTTHPVEA